MDIASGMDVDVRGNIFSYRNIRVFCDVFIKISIITFRNIDGDITCASLPSLGTTPMLTNFQKNNAL